MESMLKVGFYPGNEVRVVEARLFGGRRGQQTDQNSEECDRQECELSADPSPLTVGANSSPLSSEKPGYGVMPRATKFGNNAKRRLSRAGGMLDELAPIGQTLFLTGTLPGGTDAAKRAIASWSSWLVLELKKWLFKREKTAYSFYCWEWQKRGALHIHYAVWVKSEAARKFVLGNFKGFWYKLMLRVSTRAGVDVFERSNGGSWAERPDVIQADCQIVNKSVSRYLSKYLSKSAKGGPGSGYYSPVRWFGVSRPLSAAIAENTQEFEVRYTSEYRFRRDRERLYSIHSKAEGLRYQYGDRVGAAQVTVIFPESPAEFKSLLRSIQMSFDNSNPSIISPARSGRLLRGYFVLLRQRHKGFDSFLARSCPSRLRWLEALDSDVGCTSADFLVVTRWLMTCWAEYSGPRIDKRLMDYDAKISEYLLLVAARFKTPSEPYLLASPAVNVSVIHTQHKRSQIRLQYRA